MKEYTLPRTGGTARVSLLEGNDLTDVLALQEATRAALAPDMKMFVLPQSTAYFQNLLTRQTGVMVGIRAEGKLIAQMGVMGPLPLREAIMMQAITKNDVPFHHAGLTESVAVFKSMAVHPDWRGNDLAQGLIAFALDLPLVRVAAHVFAQISAANKRSWDMFVKLGFGIVAAAQDPVDQQPRFIFQKPAFGFDFAPAIIADEVDPVADFPAIVNLTQREALIGIYEKDAPTDTLTFMRSRDMLNLMPTLARVQAGE